MIERRKANNEEEKQILIGEWQMRHMSLRNVLIGKCLVKFSFKYINYIT